MLTLQIRTSWFEDAVLATLSSSFLFSFWPRALLANLVSVYEEVTYAPGSAIVTVGETGDSIFAILDGDAEVEDMLGTHIGVLRSGAIFGELACMGLLRTRTTSVLAGPSGCVALALSAATVNRILTGPDAGEEEGAVFKELTKLIASRE